MSALPAASELTLAQVQGLTLREAWDLEEQLDAAREVLSERIDDEIRRRVAEGWTSRKIAEEVGRHQSTVVRRCARIGVALSDPRGGARELVLMQAHQKPDAPESAPEPEEPEEVTGEVVVLDEKRNDRLAVHFSSATDEWATPQDFFDRVASEFDFELDVCALPSSAKCERYFGPEDDGLSHDWTGVCWMNPPYGTEIGAWVRKAWESAKAGATVVCLVPARTDTNWWHDHCSDAEVRFIKGRLRFGDAEASAPFPNALVVFGREPAMFNWEWR